MTSLGFGCVRGGPRTSKNDPRLQRLSLLAEGLFDRRARSGYVVLMFNEGDGLGPMSLAARTKRLAMICGAAAAPLWRTERTEYTLVFRAHNDEPIEGSTAIAAWYKGKRVDPPTITTESHAGDARYCAKCQARDAAGRFTAAATRPSVKSKSRK